MILDIDDLPTLCRLLDRALDLGAEALEPWLAGLAADHRRFVPWLRERLGEQLRGGGSSFMAAPPRLSPPRANLAGDRLGPYRLRQQIGRGGMSTVWLAERAEGGCDGPFAIKLPLAMRSDLARRLEREREITAAMRHPQVARLRDFGVDALKGPYLVLDHIDGQPLDRWCESHRLGAAARLRLFLQVARAVAYVHGRGVVHRDLKPSNILVTPTGQVRVLDFGIAEWIGEDRSSGPGRSLTPAYASPEQRRGAATTPASDVYSLGLLLSELLTGRLPGQGPSALTATTADASACAGPRAGHAFSCGPARGDLETILARALHPEAGQRHPHATALAEDIQRHLDRTEA